MLRVTDRSASVEAALIDDVVDRQPGAELIYADWLEDAGRAEDAALWRSPPADTVDALSLAQQRYLPVWRNAWLRIGLAADPTMDRALVEGLIGEVYRAGGLEPPAIYVYLDSPLRGVVGAWLLASGQVYSQVASQVHSQVHSQVDSQVHSQVHSQVRSQVDLQVASQVRSQVYSQVHSQVYSRVDLQVASQVRSQVRSQVASQVHSQVYSQVDSQVHSQVHSQVYSQVASQVHSQVHSQVASQVHSQVHSQVASQVHSQVASQVHSQVDSQVASQVRSQVGSQTWRACYGSHGAGWLSYYSFFLTVRRLPCCERLLPLIRLARRVGWWWPFAEAAIVTPRPSRLVMRRRRLVEIEYPDGWGFRADHE